MGAQTLICNFYNLSSTCPQLFSGPLSRARFSDCISWSACNALHIALCPLWGKGLPKGPCTSLFPYSLSACKRHADSLLPDLTSCCTRVLHIIAAFLLFFTIVLCSTIVLIKCTLAEIKRGTILM